ncbi:MAG: FAD-binding protein, partial [Okeania sp. SIO1H6]|nr:FAD-binding protein [Okeania sp. SIO1H6]
MAVSITSPSLADKFSAIPEYDAIVIGSGMGGLVTATQLVAKGAKVIVL